MGTFVCLLRGINVGGHRKAPMADLRALLTDLGFGGVRTYIQSGNAVFTAAETAGSVRTRVERALEERFGFVPRVLVVSRDAWEAIVQGCAFPLEAAEDPKKVHAFFLAGEPSPEAIAALGDLDTAPDAWALGPGVLYLHTPDGLGRSKAAAAIERRLGVPATARGWRSVLAIRDLLAEVIGS